MAAAGRVGPVVARMSVEALFCDSSARGDCRLRRLHVAGRSRIPGFRQPLERLGGPAAFWADEPEIAAVMTVISVCSVELCFLAAAFILHPGERATSGCGQAMPMPCGTRGFSPQAVPLILLIGLAVIPISAAAHEFYNTHPFPTSRLHTPDVPGRAAPNSQAMKDYQAAQVEYQLRSKSYGRRWRRSIREYQRMQPSPVRNAPELIGWTCIAAGVWVLWTLLRAIGAPCGLTLIVRPPMCEFCGYNLPAPPSTANVRSAARPRSTHWGRMPGRAQRSIGQPRVSWLSAWWKCAVEAMRSPGRWGRG